MSTNFNSLTAYSPNKLDTFSDIGYYSRPDNIRPKEQDIPALRQNKTDTVEISGKNKEKSSTKKKVGIAVALTATVAAAAVLLAAYSGKKTNGTDKLLSLDNIKTGFGNGWEKLRSVFSKKETSTPAKKDLTFVNANGEEVSNVKFSKGVALNESGETFTGKLTKTINGKQTVVEYQEGRPVKTMVDGVLRKEFKPVSVVDGKSVQEIVTYDENSKLVSNAIHMKGEDGKILRTFRQKNVPGDFGTAIDFEGGKIVARTTYAGTGSGIGKCEIYGEDGKTVVKTITQSKYRPDSGCFDVTEYAADGSKRILTKNQIPAGKSFHCISAKELADSGLPIRIESYGADSKIQNILSVDALDDVAKFERQCYDAAGNLTDNISIASNASKGSLRVDKFVDPLGKSDECFTVHYGMKDGSPRFTRLHHTQTGSTVLTGNEVQSVRNSVQEAIAALQKEGYSPTQLQFENIQSIIEKA